MCWPYMKGGSDIRSTSSIGYSSHDPAVIARQMKEAKAMGITGFVVDWYGDRQPFIDRSYQLVQEQAGKNKFKVAMMYDETNQEDGATDEAIADFTMFHDTYLTTKSPGYKAYLTYEGRPVIFIFPKGGHTDWDKVRAVVNTWDPSPLLIQENLPGKYANDFAGFYAWVSLDNRVGSRTEATGASNIWITSTGRWERSTPTKSWWVARGRALTTARLHGA